MLGRCGRKPRGRFSGGPVQRGAGVLILNGTTLDKPHAGKMELAARHRSGRHRRVVSGINLLTLLRSDGGALIPCDFRICDKPLSGKNKNDYFRELLQAAHERGFQPVMSSSIAGTAAWKT